MTKRKETLVVLQFHQAPNRTVAGIARYEKTTYVVDRVAINQPKVGEFWVCERYSRQETHREIFYTVIPLIKVELPSLESVVIRGDKCFQPPMTNENEY